MWTDKLLTNEISVCLCLNFFLSLPGMSFFEEAEEEESKC